MEFWRRKRSWVIYKHFLVTEGALMNGMKYDDDSTNVCSVHILESRLFFTLTPKRTLPQYTRFHLPFSKLSPKSLGCSTHLQKLCHRQI